MSELTPITRKETFLAKAGGQNVVTPTPITREETFLQAIIDNGSGGGGGTGGGVLIVHSTYDEATQIETLDTTASVIMAAMKSGLVMIVNEEDAYDLVQPLIFSYFDEEEGYSFYCVEGLLDADHTNYVMGKNYLAASGTDYPATVPPDEG